MSKDISVVSPSPKDIPSNFISLALFLEITNAIHRDKKRLTGKILTLIDASMPENDQKKAIKDLIQQDIFDSQNLKRSIESIIGTLSMHLEDNFVTTDEEKTQLKSYRKFYDFDVLRVDFQKELKSSRVG